MKNLALNQIVGDVSHDIQSKIMSIKAQIYLARHGKGDLEKVETELQQLSYLFDDLTTLIIFYESKDEFDQSNLKVEKFINSLSVNFSLSTKIDKNVSSDYIILANQDLVNWFFKIFEKYLLLKNFKKSVRVLVGKKGQGVEIKYVFDGEEKATVSRLEKFYLFSLKSVANLLKFTFEVGEDNTYSLIV